MGFSSKKWAHIISNFASILYFFIIIVQVPLFRVPCRIGTCQTPVEVMACAGGFLPEFVVKALLYPRAVKRSLMKGAAVPSPDQLLHPYKFKKGKPTDLKQLEVIAGSYLSVTGAFLGLLRHGRMSYFGLILVLWGIAKEMFGGKHASGACLFPEMVMTMVIAFLSMRRDVRKLLKCCKPGRFARRLKNRSKAKYS
ncbi:uncharacterized protein LOC121804287 [Salvia splendens]|uniref:uncharacterized protein LOC121804287 n=1 Tax=Salvia splendens TaxID=180675 RepID=UPI001C2679FF|nr:uncharacterized protein LOC121804287 [Salvia splendens]